MTILLGIAVVAASGAGAVAWWRFRQFMTHYGTEVVSLLQSILEELRKGSQP